MEKLFNVEELAQALRINKQTAQRFIREGKIKAHKVGKRYMVKESDIDAYLTKVYQ